MLSAHAISAIPSPVSARVRVKFANGHLATGITGGAQQCTIAAGILVLEQGASMSLRPIKRLIKSKPTVEGAGVHLRRAFGFGNTSEFDPFLLLDDFRNDIPEDYVAGFP